MTGARPAATSGGLGWSVLTSRRNASLAALSVLGGAGTILAGVGLMTVSGYLISRASERPPILDLMLVFVAVRFFGLARPALRYCERLVSHDLTFRLLLLFRRRFVAALLPLSPGQLAAFRAGDLLSRLASDVDTLQEAWLRVIAPAFIASLTTIVVVGGLAMVDVTLAAVVLALLIFNGVVWTVVAERSARGIGTLRNDCRRALASDLVMVRQGLDDILAFGYEDHAFDRIAGRQREIDGVENRYGRRLAVHNALASGVSGAAFAAALVLALSAAFDGAVPAVWIASLALATVAAFEAVEGLPAAWQFAGQTRDSSRRVLDVMATPPALIEPADPLRLPGRGPVGLEFHDVTFRYDSHDVLRDLSLSVGAGEHVAILGPTGSGKSTLLALAARAWDPTTGSVSLGGIDLRRVGTADLRSRVAVVPQQVHVFNWTLRENVRLARPLASDAEVLDAIEHAGLRPFVRQLPLGLDTVLGEFGARVSAGERQRIAVARVLLADAGLVLLDEPTANLDVESERSVLQEIRDWAAGRTMILVSHRPAALHGMDRVLKMSGGTLSRIG